VASKGEVLVLSLNDILIALGGVLVIIVALHAYAHWSIRNLDRNKETKNREDAFLRRSDPTARSGDMSAIRVGAQDAPRRQL
jgi:hypothetical protein